jgi:aspartate aminotransferase-like enzyme
VINEVRHGLLKANDLDSAAWTTIIMQGSGTYGVESVVSSVVDKSKGGCGVA